MAAERIEYQFMAYPAIADTDDDVATGVFLAQLQGFDAEGPASLDELNLYATIFSEYVENPAPTELHYHHLQMSGGEVVAEFRTVTPDHQYSIWTRQADVSPIRIPGFEERIVKILEGPAE